MKGLSHAAVSRPARFDRLTVAFAGSAAIAAGAAVLVVGTGVLGRARAGRPIADPIALAFLRDHQLAAQIAGLVLAALLVVLGLWLAVRTVRPEARPDLVLADDLVVSASAIAAAIRADAERVTGVAEARARVVRVGDTPALRLYLSLRHGADVRAVWSELDQQVLARARRSLGVPDIPTAIRLELGTAQRQRVS